MQSEIEKAFPEMAQGDLSAELNKEPSTLTETSPVTGQVAPTLAPSPTISSIPTTERAAIEAQQTPEAKVPIEIGATPATIPRFGEKGTMARGASEALAGLGEFVLNKPEEFLASIYPPTSTAVLARYAPSVVKDFAVNTWKGLRGDKEAMANAATVAAMVGIPFFKKGLEETIPKETPREPPIGTPIPATAAALKETAAPVANELSTPPSTTLPLGIVHPSSVRFIQSLHDAFIEPAKQAFADLSWRRFAQEALPAITEANRESGEAGVRLAVANQYARQAGTEFARDVLEGLPVDDVKFGVALKEDNLRDIKQGFEQKAVEARAKAESTPNAAEAFLEDAQLYDNAAQNVGTFINGEGSPFPTEESYQAFLRDPATQEAIARHKQLWTEQKEPLYREAANIDPETELASRGLQTGARINLTHVEEGEPGMTQSVTVPGGVRQLGTLLRRDPFARHATGTGTYTPSYTETMAQAFAREYPVAAQHEFVRTMLEKGVAQVGPDARAPSPDLKAYPLRIRPWNNQYLYLPKKLAADYEPIVGLQPGVTIPGVTPVARALAHQAILGLGEGTAHSANIMLKLFTGITTEHPILESFLSALPFRPDLLYSAPKAILRGLRPDSKGMLELARIGAAKIPYSGPISSKFLNPLDRGVRLASADVYDGLAERGIVPDTETGKREFVNEVGNYTSSLQSPLVRNLRSSGVQPFATGFRTAKVQAVKRLATAPGLEGTTPLHAAALHTAIAAKFVGTALTVATINYLLNGTARGLPGTRLGAVSWEGKDGKTHEFDLGGFLGATTGARAIGLMGTVEAKERGLDTGTALASGARSIGTTLTSQFAGPVVRTTTIGLTGKDPYGFQIADMKPPTDNVFASQMASNIKAAAQQVNPVVDLLAGLHEGKTWEELRQRQLTRYATRTPSGVQTSENYAQIVTRANLNKYADWLSSEARKRGQGERLEWIIDRLDKDNLEGADRKQVLTELRRKGTFKFE